MKISKEIRQAARDFVRASFVNGVLDGVSNGGTGLLTANPVIHFGGNTLDGRYFLGLMDEVRAYNRVLSDAEVAALAAAGGYESWVATTMPNASAALTDPSADADGDGQNNFLEFAFGTNPLVPNASAFTIVRASDGSLWLSYPRRTGFAGLRYTIWQSDDLATWSPIPEGFLEESVQSMPGQPMESVTGRITDVTQSAFFRLEVNSIEP